MCKENYFQLLKEVIEERIPFNKLIGLKIEKLDLESIGIRFKMRPELVGNFMRGNLHGGVISSVLDYTGGMVALTGIMKKMVIKFIISIVVILVISAFFNCYLLKLLEAQQYRYHRNDKSNYDWSGKH